MKSTTGSRRCSLTSDATLQPGRLEQKSYFNCHLIRKKCQCFDFHWARLPDNWNIKLYSLPMLVHNNMLGLIMYINLVISHRISYNIFIYCILFSCFLYALPPYNYMSPSPPPPTTLYIFTMYFYSLLIFQLSWIFINVFPLHIQFKYVSWNSDWNSRLFQSPSHQKKNL